MAAMIIVLLVHLLLALALLPWGLVVLRSIGVRAAVPPAIVLVFCGYAFAALFTMVWSFVAPVDLWALTVFSGGSMAVAWWQRQVWGTVLHGWNTTVKATPWPVRVLFGLIALVAWLKAAGPSEMFDEGGYYMPYMKWIERFPLVPGLAQVEDRMGFNSMHHLVSALFSLDGLGTGGYYDLNAFLLVIMAAWLVQGCTALLQGRWTALDVGRVLCLFLLMRNMLTSATSDLPVLLLGQLVLLLFIQRMEAGNMERRDGEGVLLLLLACLAVTIKFSALPLVLPGLWVLVRQWRAGAALPIVPVMSIGVLLFVPWLLRSYYLSGYLVYPLYQVDLFAPDWKLPKGIAETQFHYVSEFARTNAGRDESPHLAATRGIREWFPLWYARETLLCRAAFWALVAGVLWCLARAVAQGRRWRVQPDAVFLVACLLAGLWLWFYRHPSFRFGWAWVLVFLAVVLFDVVRKAGARRWVAPGLLAALALSTLANVFAAFREHRGALVQRWLEPAAPHHVTTTADERFGFPVQVAPAVPCWAVAPPCFSAGMLDRVEARGPRVEDGFRSRTKRGKKTA